MKDVLIKVSTITILSSFLIVGCSSKDDASVSNFESVIADYYAAQDTPATCVGGELDSFPYQIPRNYINISDVSLEDRIAALADAGLIEQVGPNHYGITEVGQSAFNPDEGFCFGTIKVAEVTNFTEPSSNGAYTISRVNYTIEVADRPEWSKSSQLVDTFALSDDGLITAGFLSRNDNPERKSIVLVKTNNGWVTEHDMN
ncbi:hypothetical protein [Halomonas campaniensis]|uniref:Uncharacterized protein n=1 Tax=Halomonas campaniensis TaxID=213554 RepID=A0A246S4V0_9GAMM|nr:hypothetical protein [Halomonas campaniensis]OWV31250.1 hypothetical protein JI62_02570 [Halomonas campaniensis]